jgi:SAM-dependent methyltransferase
MIQTLEQTATACRNCQSSCVRVFYRTGAVPVHSCLMLDDEAAAREFPRRPIALGSCSSCGFVSNVVFDPTVHDYAGRYQDQQSFSKRFREFQSSLIRVLIERYGLRNKSIVEIGCGKGDFLTELCRVGDNRGVGIDPRCESGQEADSAGVRFIPECYAPGHWDLPCDLLACRHTLEHLHETDQFLADIRESLSGRPGTLVFFEVPDATRVFKEQAFWDIYYEHCSYFTPGSLARVFRRNRFEVLDLARVFEDQYLTIVARPTDRVQMGSLPVEEAPEEWARDLEVFTTKVNQVIAGWKDKLERLNRQGRQVAVWGAGSKCVSFLSTLECEQAVQTVVDINPHQQNKCLPGSGKRIMPPEALRERRPDVVLVMNPVYRDEIGHQLGAMDIHPELMCV